MLSGYRENAYSNLQIDKKYKRSTVSRSLVFKWFKRFKDGRASLQEEGRGRKLKINQRLVTSVHDALKEDRRLTVRDLAEKFDMSVGTVHTILVEKLKMSKVFHLI